MRIGDVRTSTSLGFTFLDGTLPQTAFRRSRLPATVASLLLLALATELFLRFVLGLGNPVLIAADRACGYITKPNQNIRRFLVHTYINKYGMRADEIASTKPEKVVRIYFVGDSITYGTTHVDQGEIFSEILKRELPGFVHKPVQ